MMTLWKRQNSGDGEEKRSAVVRFGDGGRRETRTGQGDADIAYLDCGGGYITRHFSESIRLYA